MKNIKLVYSKNLTDKTGASTVMRILNGCRKDFFERDILLNVYSRENLLNVNSKDVHSPDVHSQGGYKFYIINYLSNKARTSPLAALFLAYLQSMRAAKKIVHYVRSQILDGDILFFHELYTAYYYLKMCGKTNPMVVVFHDDGRGNKLLEDRYQNFHGSYFDRLLIKMRNLVAENTDYLGFVSECSMNNFRKEHSTISDKKLFFAHNGLPILSEHRMRDIGNRIEIICVGTVIESKGQIFIVEALHEFQVKGKQIPNVHFKIVGGGPLLSLLKHKTEDYGLQRYVTFYGAVNNVNEQLGSSDIFILPSTSEGLPMSILEAMRMSLPIVSTPVGGIPETIVDGVTGLIIQPSVDGVFDFLNRIGEYNWEKMSSASYDYYIKSFTTSSMVNAYSNIFNKL